MHQQIHQMRGKEILHASVHLWDKLLVHMRRNRLHAAYNDSLKCHTGALRGQNLRNVASACMTEMHSSLCQTKVGNTALSHSCVA